ncbi:MAG: hypothetical protein IPL70_11150 [Uliginosibacterium sp.]|nr:hypothetical protein [Uliginosibacterium sp.]
MERARVLNGVFPDWDVGAPSPMILASEHIVRLAYYTGDGQVAVVIFDHCFEYRMGMPDENGVSRHPLGLLGLSEYEAHQVDDSSWLRTLEDRYRVISDYTRDGRRYEHYVFMFHDRCFECVASGFRIGIQPDGSVQEALLLSVA